MNGAVKASLKARVQSLHLSRMPPLWPNPVSASPPHHYCSPIRTGSGLHVPVVNGKLAVIGDAEALRDVDLHDVARVVVGRVVAVAHEPEGVLHVPVVVTVIREPCPNTH